jgi:hypothetical protein
MRSSAILFLLLGLLAAGMPAAARADSGRASAARADLGRASAARADLGRASAARADLGRASAARADLGRASAARADLGRASAARVDLGRASAARQLSRTERALAATVQAARAPRAELGRSASAARPFWDAVDRMSRALQQADAGLRAGDSRYFAGLGEGSRALAELEVVWARTRRDPGVGAGIAALSTSYRRLRNGYGWEALRRRQGGALTAAETRRFHALQQADAQVAQHLKPVQAKAAKTGDKAMAEQLRRLREQAERVATAELTLEAYLTAELLHDIVQGEWAASQHYVKPAYRAAWRKAAPAIEKLATDPGVGFVFTADLSKAEAWSFDAGADEASAAAAPAAPTKPAVDDTPVDEVEIVEGRPHRTAGVEEDGTALTDEEAPAAVAPTPASEPAEIPAMGAPAGIEDGPTAESAPVVAPPPVQAVPAEPAPSAEPAPVPPAAVPPADGPEAGAGEGTAINPATMGDDEPPPVIEPGSGRPAAPQVPPDAAPQDPDVIPTPPPDAPLPGDAPAEEPDITARPPESPPPAVGGDPADQPPPADADPRPVEPPPPPPA